MCLGKEKNTLILIPVSCVLSWCQFFTLLMDDFMLLLRFDFVVIQQTLDWNGHNKSRIVAKRKIWIFFVDEVTLTTIYIKLSYSYTIYIFHLETCSLILHWAIRIILWCFWAYNITIINNNKLTVLFQKYKKIFPTLFN